jgi:hypothetical protein
MADEQIRILFLAANPKTTAPLDLDTEFNQIESALGETRHTQRILLQHRWKLSRDQLLDLLLQYRPHIVHFSGHGTEDNLLLQDRDGNAWPLDRATARAAFKTTANTTRMVVLNACYSRDVAEDVSEVVDCVIGMSQPVYDNTAIRFASALYRGLGDGLSVREAFDRARAQIAVSGLKGATTPQILTKPALDPRTVYPLDWIPAPYRSEAVAVVSSDWIDEPRHRAPAGTPLPTPKPSGPAADRPSVRRLLDKHIPDDASFDAFVLDHFPEVKRRFAGGMDRIQKTNLLLTIKEPSEVHAALQIHLQG